jgi:aspartyl-tRNA(Asn)/glutamyl-tRNA(Gln) amidotransferase subunit B
MNRNESYELVVGLEVHARLLTRSKLFCGDSSFFGNEPNTNISPVTLAHPGTLPKMNKAVIGFAVKLGLACHSEIEKQNYFARKNYFYPDLPKGYQISQHTTPICKGGFISVDTRGKEKNIRLNRIHIEEDAGKSMHDIFETDTALDYNRAGTPLLEIVTEPDISSGEEAYACLSELRKIVRYLEICDGNMEEGSFRCDANVSVRKNGETKLGTKVEVKNLNSMRNVKLAIEFEADRLISLLEKGETVWQQTRSFDAASGTTFAIRDKEDADDYRYFADPDLTPFVISDELIAEINNDLPVLHFQRVRHYVSAYQLSSYDASVLTEEKEIAEYFEKLISPSSVIKVNPKSAANWMMGPVKTWLKETGASISKFSVRPEILSKLIKLVDENKLSFSAASTSIFTALIKNPEADPLGLAEKMNMLMESNPDYIISIASDVILQFENKVQEYRKGKKGLLALFVGEVMKRSKGKADPKMVNEILLKLLNDNK